MSRDLTNKHRSRKLFVWKRLKKMAKKYMIYVVKRKSMLACTRLSRLSRKLVAKDKSRRACFNIARLSRKLVAKHDKMRQMTILGRWRKLINGLLRKDEGNQPRKTTAMERWGVLVGKTLVQIRQDKGEVSWLAGTRAMKEAVLDPKRKM